MVMIMAKCKCGGEYSVFDDECSNSRCKEPKKLGNKVVDVVNEVGDLIGI